MVSMIRTLLIWMLVLAVPAQGIAAVTLASCGPNHAFNGQAVPSQHAAAGDHAHRGSTADSLPGQDRLAAQPDDDTTVPMGVAGSAKFVQADTCSACASCCSAAAVLGSMPRVAAPEVGAAVFVSLAAAVEAFAADSPDRPPRSDPA